MYPSLWGCMPDVAVRREPASTATADTSSEVRERLADAATRAAAECGYPAIDIEQIVQYADVSVDDFHRHFSGKDECFLVAYERFLARMFEHIDEACEAATDWPDKVKITIESAFGFVAELEEVARLFAVDKKGAGPGAIALTLEAIDSAALRLKHGRLLYPESDYMPDTTERTLVGGVVLIASEHLLAEDAHRLPGFATEAAEMVLTPYLGSREARRVAAA